MSVVDEMWFYDEEEAYRALEERVWPDGPVCPHCGGGERIGRLNGKSTRIGTYKCYECRKPFTVKVGTVLESSHVPLHAWMKAIYLLSSSNKRVSLLQLHRSLGVTLKTAWFMAERIRGPLHAQGGPPRRGRQTPASLAASMRERRSRTVFPSSQPQPSSPEMRL